MAIDRKQNKVVYAGMVATTGVVVSAFLFTPLFKVYKIKK
jgi:hypothetical protein